MRCLTTIVVLLACGTPPPPPPPDGGCTSTVAAYPDADGDAFGSANDSPLIVCAGQVPSGFTTSNHLDCADGDARANPAAGSVFQTMPITGISANPWDFNCDGQVTAQWPTNTAICAGFGGCQFANNAWQDSAPACGVSGTWITDCRGVGPSAQCVLAGSSQRTQACY